MSQVVFVDSPGINADVAVFLTSEKRKWLDRTIHQLHLGYV
jgi:hypothetical protein